MLDDLSGASTVYGMFSEQARRLGVCLLALVALSGISACSSSTKTPPTPGNASQYQNLPDAPGTYKLQQTGPGGGVIFYAARKPFRCGPDLTGVCHYLEVAPFDSEVERGWSSEDNASRDVAGSEGSAIGTGWSNTIAIITQGNTDPDVSAAAYADAYEHNGYSDWYLPSRDELHELTITREVIGGFTMETYWSSTERDGGRVWYQNFLNGFQFLDGKSELYLVRPIRAF